MLQVEVKFSLVDREEGDSRYSREELASFERIVNIPPGVSPYTVGNEIATAFASFSQAAGFYTYPDVSPADIAAAARATAERDEADVEAYVGKPLMTATPGMATTAMLGAVIGSIAGAGEEDDEPTVTEPDPGPEVDDVGGMSEVPPLAADDRNYDPLPF